MVDLGKRTDLVSGGNVVMPVTAPVVQVVGANRVFVLWERLFFMLPGLILFVGGIAFAVFGGHVFAELAKTLFTGSGSLYTVKGSWSAADALQAGNLLCPLIGIALTMYGGLTAVRGWFR